jgi:hypothetical protein
MKQEIPALARPYFEDLIQVDEAKDLPSTLMLPMQREILDTVMCEDEQEAQNEVGRYLSSIISKWSALSIS